MFSSKVPPYTGQAVTVGLPILMPYLWPGIIND